MRHRTHHPRLQGRYADQHIPGLPLQVVVLLLSSEDCEQWSHEAEPALLEQMPVHTLPIGHALQDEQQMSGLQRYMHCSGTLQVRGPHIIEHDTWHNVKIVVNKGFKGRLAKVIVALRGRSVRFVRGCCGAKFACAKLQYEPMQ